MIYIFHNKRILFYSSDIREILTLPSSISVEVFSFNNLSELQDARGEKFQKSRAVLSGCPLSAPPSFPRIPRSVFTEAAVEVCGFAIRLLCSDSSFVFAGRQSLETFFGGCKTQSPSVAEQDSIFISADISLPSSLSTNALNNSIIMQRSSQGVMCVPLRTTDDLLRDLSKSNLHHFY